MSGFGFQNQTIALTPTGYIDSAYLNGADGSDSRVAWVTGNGTTLTNLLNAMVVGTPVSIDLTQFYTDPGSPNAEVGFYAVAGDAPPVSGFAISGGSPPRLLSNTCLQAVGGSFRLVLVRNGYSVLSDVISFTVSAPQNVTDTISPTTPTTVVAGPGTLDNTIALSFDAPVDIAPAGANASGSAHVDVLVNGAVSNPSPILVAANTLLTPTAVQLGSFATPAFNQNGKQWVLSTGGTGISATASEQAFMLDFGAFSGACQVIAQIDAYVGGAATNAFVGIILHETGVAGGKFIAFGMGPSDGTVGLKVIQRATAGAASTTAFTVVNDTNGHAITGPVYVKIVRSSDLKTLTLSYSLTENGKVPVGTSTITMNASVRIGLVATATSSTATVTATVEELAITTAKQSYSATVPATATVGLQLRAVDAAGNVSDVSPSLTATPKLPTQNNSGKVRIHPGNRFWLDNPSYPGNQQGEIAAACSLMASNQFNGMGIIMTWANISDAALTGGAQTFTIFKNNMQDVLNRVNAASPNKKLYITFKWWQGTFYPSYITTTTAQSGNTLTVTGSTLPGGLVQAVVGGHNYGISSNTSTTVTLSSSPGTVPNGTQAIFGKATANDASLWPTWLINKGNWVKTFIQPNGNARGQLDYDNAAVWAATQEMFAGIVSVLNQIDVNRQVDIIAVGDETIAATIDKGGVTICNGTNYDNQLVATLKYVEAQAPDRTIWVPFNYSADNNDAAGTQSIFSQLEAYKSSRFGYGGPDSPTFGTHGNINGWYTTFLNVITGLTGTLGDVRDTVLRIGNTEGPGLLGAGLNFASKPTLTLQQGFDDIMTRKSIPPNVLSASTTIAAHTGIGCSVMHWDYQTRFYFKTSDIVAVVNANNGFFTPLPPGNWDTSA